MASLSCETRVASRGCARRSDGGRDGTDEMTIAEAAKRIEGREFRSELTEAYLARKSGEPGHQCNVTVTAARRGRTRKRRTRRIAAGATGGHCTGSHGLKDLYDTAGIETAGGSRILKGRVPEHDSTWRGSWPRPGRCSWGRRTRTSSPGGLPRTTLTRGPRITRGSWTGYLVDRAAVRGRQSRRGWQQGHWGPTPGAASASRRRCAGAWASSRRSDA